MNEDFRIIELVKNDLISIKKSIDDINLKLNEINLWDGPLSLIKTSLSNLTLRIEVNESEIKLLKKQVSSNIHKITDVTIKVAMIISLIYTLFQSKIGN